MTTIFQEKAMLAALHLHGWTASRIDRKVTNEIHQIHGASSNSGQYNKNLIDKARLAGIQKVDSLLRQFHEENTLPWSAAGVRLLATANYFDYTAGIRALKDQRDSEVRDLLDHYPDYVEEARNRRNGMFRAEDYPTPERLRSMYHVEVNYWPFPDVQDFRVSLASEDMARITQDTKQRIREAEEAAMRDPWQRLYEAVGSISEKLHKAPGNLAGGTFRDSLIGNLRELLVLLPRLNLTGDPRLEEIRQEALARLVHAPGSIRESDALRAVVANGADDIMRKMAGYMA